MTKRLGLTTMLMLSSALLLQAVFMQSFADVKSESNMKKIVLGSGCFWGAEKRYESLDGVIDAVSGYTGGKGLNPDYKTITQAQNRHNPNNFAEVVEVSFDASKITTAQLLKNYFENHDPTQLNRQGNDIGTQYRSVIYTMDDTQAMIAKQLIKEYQQKLTQAGYGTIKTQVLPLDTFYPAEEYHQNYLKKNPNGYCPNHATDVKFDEKPLVKVDNTVLMKGKHILVIDADFDCPFCEKFKKDVRDGYQGSIPMTTCLATQLDGLTIHTPTWATPTIIFLEDGKEIAGHQGYMTPEAFYKALGAFKLGQSEAYAVAFHSGTDGRFCRQYEEYKNTKPGFFVDGLSGVKLFDTEYRFDSGSGWLSFTQAIEGEVTYHQDDSHGMSRVEIRSASSGIHLGHVFNDGPEGQSRYCINATVLDFIEKA